MMPDANVSGPIVKNKTFFFLGYQRLHEKGRPRGNQQPDKRDEGGRFEFPGRSERERCLSIQPQRAGMPDGTWARDPFAGNRIP